MIHCLVINTIHRNLRIERIWQWISENILTTPYVIELQLKFVFKCKSWKTTWFNFLKSSINIFRVGTKKCLSVLIPKANKQIVLHNKQKTFEFSSQYFIILVLKERVNILDIICLLVLFTKSTFSESVLKQGKVVPLW